MHNTCTCLLHALADTRVRVDAPCSDYHPHFVDTQLTTPCCCVLDTHVQRTLPNVQVAVSCFDRTHIVDADSPSINPRFARNGTRFENVALSNVVNIKVGALGRVCARKFELKKASKEL